jgi:hypothetical protein
VQFFYHHAVKGTPIPELIADTVSHYGAFLLSVEQNIAVLDVPPAGVQENVFEFEYYAPQDQRAYITKEWNRQLGEFCEANGIQFVQIWHYLADERGFLKPEYAEPDGAHVSREAVKFVEMELRCE